MNLLTGPAHVGATGGRTIGVVWRRLAANDVALRTIAETLRAHAPEVVSAGSGAGDGKARRRRRRSSRPHRS